MAAPRIAASRRRDRIVPTSPTAGGRAWATRSNSGGMALAGTAGPSDLAWDVEAKQIGTAAYAEKCPEKMPPQPSTPAAGWPIVGGLAWPMAVAARGVARHNRPPDCCRRERGRDRKSIRLNYRHH